MKEFLLNYIMIGTIDANNKIAITVFIFFINFSSFINFFNTIPPNNHVYTVIIIAISVINTIILICQKLSSYEVTKIDTADV